MDRSDFENIVDEYGNQLYGYLMRFLANREDVEDILQSVFIAFYNHLDNIDPSKHGSYLYRTAHNQAINYKKKRSRFVGLDEKQIVNLSTNDPKENSIDSEKKTALKDALSKLKPKEALAIELKFFQNKSYHEIAEIMGLSSKAVDSLLVRAKKKLRKKMQDLS